MTSIPNWNTCVTARQPLLNNLSVTAQKCKKADKEMDTSQAPS